MIAKQNAPYIIAEISGNHNGEISNAKKLISIAAKAGADCVKLQTYTPQTMTLRSDRPDFKITGGLWDGRTLWDLYEEAHTPLEWHAELFSHAEAENITCISTPFDETAVSLLEELNCPFYKIASFELTDLPLIKSVALTKKPIIMSTGLASLDEISAAIETAEKNGTSELYILHCVSGYPTPINEINVSAINRLRDLFGDRIGLSDHTLGHVAATAATALGAKIIEKHITIDRRMGGPDADFSIEPEELAALVSLCRQTAAAMGNGALSRAPSEEQNRKFRRSLYATRDIQPGEPFSPENIKRVRPGYGLAPRYYEALLGSRCQKAIEAGEAITFDHTSLNAQ